MTFTIEQVYLAGALGCLAVAFFAVRSLVRTLRQPKEDEELARRLRGEPKKAA